MCNLYIERVSIIKKILALSKWNFIYAFKFIEPSRNQPVIIQGCVCNICEKGSMVQNIHLA